MGQKKTREKSALQREQDSSIIDEPADLYSQSQFHRCNQMASNKRTKDETADPEPKGPPVKKAKTTGIPVHRGKFKNRFTKKHTMLLQRNTPGYLASCDLTGEAKAMVELTSLIPKILRERQFEIREVEVTSEASKPFANLVIEANESDEVGIEEVKAAASSGLLNLYDTGVAGLVFGGVRPNVEFDVIEGIKCIAKHVQETTDEKMKFRFCHKVYPVERTCNIDLANVCKTVGELLDSRGISEMVEKKEKTFRYAIECRVANCASLNRRQVIGKVAESISAKFSSHVSDEFAEPVKVDLSNPEFTVFVAVVKAVTMISLVSEFPQLYGLNMQLLQQHSSKAQQ
jgi:tRNA(Ser,Leu) C12 N-acetylase TAN1